MEQISASAEELSASIQELSGAASEVMAAVEQINKASQLQSAATQQTSAALNQIEGSARLAQQNGKTARDRARSLDAAVKNGRKSIGILIEGVATALQGTQSSVATIKRVEGVGRRIEKIVDAIALVAVQTSMLAVSGAVEAARAGDAGRGFAVVSNDIRSLAREAAENVERAKDTVRGILDQIAALRIEFEQVINATELEVQNSRMVSAGLQKIEHDIVAVSAASQSILDGADNILAATSEMTKAARQIAAAAEEASTASREAAAAATQQSRGVEDLAAAHRGNRDTCRRIEAEVGEPRVNAALPSASTRFLTFEVDALLYALGTEDVAEVIRLPALARVPQGPPALLGVANLRGSVLPVASLRVMLGNEPHQPATARAIVLDVGAPVAIVVDAVATLESVDAGQIEKPGKEPGAEGTVNLLGAFAVAGTQRVARILDIRALLDAAFARRAQAKAQDLPRDTVRARRQMDSARDNRNAGDLRGGRSGICVAAECRTGNSAGTCGDHSGSTLGGGRPRHHLGAQPASAAALTAYPARIRRIHHCRCEAESGCAENRGFTGGSGGRSGTGHRRRRHCTGGSHAAGSRRPHGRRVPYPVRLPCRRRTATDFHPFT